MTTSRSGVNVADLKSALGPLGWSVPFVDWFFKAKEFDDFLARVQAVGRTYFFTCAKEQAQLGSVWNDECLARVPRHGSVVVMANHPH